jgi:hypothetical protein
MIRGWYVATIDATYQLGYAENAVVSMVFKDVPEDIVVSMVRSLRPPSSDVALFGATLLLTYTSGGSILIRYGPLVLSVT